MKFFRGLIISLGVVFVIIITLLLATFIVVKRLKIKDIVESEIEKSLGINVTVGRINLSPLLAHIELADITIHNPDGYPEGELAYINSLHFVVDPLEIITNKKPNIYLCVLNLERLNVIKNKAGKVNIKELAPISQAGAPADDQSPFYFDVLVLSISQVRYIDYSGGSRKEYNYPVGIRNATFVGLTNEWAVVKMVLFEALKNTDVGKLVNLTIVPVFTDISNTLDSALGTAKAGIKSAWQIATLPVKLIFGN